MAFYGVSWLDFRRLVYDAVWGKSPVDFSKRAEILLHEGQKVGVLGFTFSGFICTIVGVGVLELSEISQFLGLLVVTVFAYAMNRKGSSLFLPASKLPVQN